MKVVLDIESLKDLNELTEFLLSHKNIVLKSVDNIENNNSTELGIDSNLDNDHNSLIDLLGKIKTNKDYDIHYDDPYPGYEKIPYWQRPDYTGLRPGDVVFTCSTDGCPTNCTCSNKSTASSTTAIS